jgi:hypothetical protein
MTTPDAGASFRFPPSKITQSIDRRAAQTWWVGYGNTSNTAERSCVTQDNLGGGAVDLREKRAARSQLLRQSRRLLLNKNRCHAARQQPSGGRSPTRALSKHFQLSHHNPSSSDRASRLSPLDVLPAWVHLGYMHRLSFPHWPVV